MRTITVGQLYEMMREDIKNGRIRKDQKILITTDDEGNGLHHLFFAFFPAKGNTNGVHLPYGVDTNNLDDYVILG